MIQSRTLRDGQPGGVVAQSDAREVAEIAPPNVGQKPSSDPIDRENATMPAVDHVRTAQARASTGPSGMSALFGELGVVARASAAIALGMIRGRSDPCEGAHIVPDIGERVDPSRHLAQPWRLHSLAPDFKLVDVWALPIKADPSKGETFAKFFDMTWKNGIDSDSQIEKFFVWFRGVLGEAFHWEPDTSKDDIKIAGTNEHSLAERLTDADRKMNQGEEGKILDTPITPLRLLYQHENDALLELNNKTLSALFHLSFVDTPDGKKTPELAVYTKGRGLKSKLYLGLIEPFRLVAVYPQWISHITRKWEELVAASPPPVDSGKRAELQTGATD